MGKLLRVVSLSTTEAAQMALVSETTRGLYFTMHDTDDNDDQQKPATTAAPKSADKVVAGAKEKELQRKLQAAERLLKERDSNILDLETQLEESRALKAAKDDGTKDFLDEIIDEIRDFVSGVRKD